MTYSEMQRAEAEYQKAISPKQTKQRGATKAQLAHRARMLVVARDTIGYRAEPPRKWHEQASGELVCPHRDCSVCRECATANPEALDCAGAHFWIPIDQRNGA